MKIAELKQRRLMIPAGILLLVVAGLYGFAPAVKQQLQIREELANKQALLAKAEKLIAKGPALKKQVDELEKTHEVDEALLYLDLTPSMAAAKMQDLLHSLSKQAEINIVRENVRPPQEYPPYTLIPVELSLQGEIHALRDFLYRMQTAPKLLTVSKLAIHSLPSLGPAGVSAELLLAGYLEVEAQEEGPGEVHRSPADVKARPAPGGK